MWWSLGVGGGVLCRVVWSVTLIFGVCWCLVVLWCLWWWCGVRGLVGQFFVSWVRWCRCLGVVGCVGCCGVCGCRFGCVFVLWVLGVVLCGCGGLVSFCVGGGLLVLWSVGGVLGV